MNLTIRKAVLEDAPVLAEIHSRGWETAYAGLVPAEYLALRRPQRPAKWRENLSQPDHEVYVPVLDGKVAGFLSLHQPDEHENLPDCYYEVGGIYLDPQYYRQGIGRRLMAFAEEQARLKGKTAMMLGVFKENAPSRRFYEACGYRPDGRTDTRDYGRPLVIMRYVKDIKGSLEIRKGTIDDAPAVAEVHSRSWEVAYADLVSAEFLAQRRAERPERWRDILSGGGKSDIFVSVLDGNVVGFMSVGPPRDEDLGDAFYEVYAIYLHPDVYRRGIGRQLMELAHTLARTKGKTSMALWVFEDNAPSRRFYEACGYQPDGAWEVEEYGGRPLRSLRYVKEIV